MFYAIDNGSNPCDPLILEGSEAEAIYLAVRECLDWDEITDLYALPDLDSDLHFKDRILRIRPWELPAVDLA